MPENRLTSYFSCLRHLKKKLTPKPNFEHERTKKGGLNAGVSLGTKWGKIKKFENKVVIRASTTGVEIMLSCVEWKQGF